HHRQGTQRAALPRLEGHHGGEKEAAPRQARGTRRGRARGARLDPAAAAQGGQGRGRGARRRARAAAAAARRGEGPVSDVLAVAEQREGALRKVSSEVVTGARRLADALAARVEALVVAAGPVQGADQLGGFRADKVLTLANPAFGRYAPEGYARVIADRARAGGYRAVVFAASAAGRDLAPRVAARLGVALAQDITDVTVEGGAVMVMHPVYAGKALLKLKLTATPAVVSLRPNVFTPVQRPKAGAAEIVPVDAAAGRVVVTGIKAAAGALDVAEASIVISGGRGLKEPPNFKVADYGVVGDLFEVVPKLTEEIRKLHG